MFQSGRTERIELSIVIYSAGSIKAQANCLGGVHLQPTDTEAYWRVLLPYLHPLQWAFDHPSHCPRKEEIRHAILNRGEAGCCTFNRGDYTFKLRHLRDWAFEQSLMQRRKIYYVSRGVNRQALLYLDADHHKPYQSPADTLMAKRVINEAFTEHLQIGGNRWVTSGGGQNGYLPVSCDSRSPQLANQVFDRLQHALRLILAEAGCLADIEIKGRVSYLDEDTGAFEWKQFGKLPLSADDFQFEILDGIFEHKLNLARLERFIEAVEQRIPENVLLAHKRRMADRAKEFAPTHLPLTPEVEAQLRVLGTWKLAMVSRQVREDGEWVAVKWLEGIQPQVAESEQEICLVDKREPGTSFADTRSRRFWSYVKELAINGVPEDDNLATYLYELARPLLFREYFNLKKEERIERTVADLKFWVTSKHNGRITRIETRESEVLSQVERVVKSALKSTDKGLLAYYADVRANDLKYPSRIQLLAPLIRGTSIEEKEDIGLVDKCMVKEPIDTPLPDVLLDRLDEIAKSKKMRRKHGEFPFVKFSRRLLNACWHHKGRAHINRATLQGYLDGGKDPNRQLAYKKLLARHGLIYGDWEQYIRRGKHAALYRLTDACFEMFEADFKAGERKEVG